MSPNRARPVEPLTARMYDQLRALARRLMRRERSDHTLQATALANEAFLRLAASPPPADADRSQFFRAAALAMQHVLIDHARRRARRKRAAPGRRVPLDAAEPAEPGPRRAGAAVPGARGAGAAVRGAHGVGAAVRAPHRAGAAVRGSHGAGDAAGPEEILAVADALGRLEKQDPEAAALVRLRFFSGLTVDEAAEALGISPRSAARQWTYARAWLYRAIQGDL